MDKDCAEKMDTVNPPADSVETAKTAAMEAAKDNQSDTGAAAVKPAKVDQFATLRRIRRRITAILFMQIRRRKHRNKPPKKFGKLRKIFNWTMGIIFGLLLLILIFRDFIIHQSIEIGGSWFTGLEITLDEFSTDLSRGQLRIVNLNVANPKSFREPHLLHLDNCFVDIDPFSIFTKDILIEDIVVENLKINGEYDLDGNLNASVLMNNINSKLPAKAEQEEENQPPEPPPEPSGLVLTISHISFSGNFSLINDYSRLIIPLPLKLELDNIVIEDDGTSIMDYFLELCQSFVDLCEGIKIGKIGKDIFNGAKDSGKFIMDKTNEGGKFIMDKINIFK